MIFQTVLMNSSHGFSLKTYNTSDCTEFCIINTKNNNWETWIRVRDNKVCIWESTRLLSPVHIFPKYD